MRTPPRSSFFRLAVLAFLLAAPITLLMDRAHSAEDWSSVPELRFPMDIGVLGERVYVSDFESRVVHVFSRSGASIARWGTRGGDVLLEGPSGVAVAPSGELYVADLAGDRILRLDSEGRILTSWGIRGKAPGEFSGPMGVAIDHAGSVYVADLENDRLQKFTPDGTVLRTWGGTGKSPGKLRHPWGVALEGNGDIWVTDHGNHRVQRFSSDGVFLSSWGQPGRREGELFGPMGIATMGDGSLLVTDQAGDRMQRFTPDGRFLGVSRSTDGRLGFAWAGLALDSNGDVLVADAAQNRVARVRAASLGDAVASTMPHPAKALTIGSLWPSPTSGSIEMRLAVPSPGDLEVAIYSINGRRVHEVRGRYGPGDAHVSWSARAQGGERVPPGIYFVRVRWSDGSREARTEGRVVVLQ